MATHQTSLGGRAAVVHAPESGSFDADAFAHDIAPGGFYGLDVEGVYMSERGQFDDDFRIRMIQFGTVDTAWVLDLDDPEQDRAAQALLRDESTWFCSHTKMDTLSVRVRWGIDISGRNTDTHVLARMAAPDENAKVDLKTLATRYGMPELAQADKALDDLFLELYQDAHDGKKGTIRSRAEYGWATVPTDHPVYTLYAGLDAIACRRLAPMLVKSGKNPVHILRTEHWVSRQATRIVYDGMLVDQDWTHDLLDTNKRVTDEQNALIEDVTGYKARSPKLWTWFDDHGADFSRFPKSSRTGNPSFEKDNPKLLLDMELDAEARKVAEALIEFKAHQYAVTKTEEILKRLTSDGRVHANLNSIEAVTARMSSSGPNLQNLPKKGPLRGCFIPDPGHVLIRSDFEQVELRVGAALAGEWRMIDVIHAGGDLHQLTSDELNIPRPLAKMTNFLLAYGGGANALNRQAGIPLEQAQGIVAGYRNTYTQIQRLTRRMAGLTEGIRTISQRWVPVTLDSAGNPRTYASVNYLIQSSARDLLVHSWKLLETRYGLADAIWLPVHDELVVQAPEDRVDEYCAALSDCMTFDFWGVPIEAEADVLVDANGVSRWMDA